LGVLEDFYFASCPDDPQMRESASVWVSDDAGLNFAPIGGRLSGSYTRVRGLASSGRYGGYNTADLSFKCDVDYRGYVRDLDINRR
jgi:hypothetical protein